MDHTLTPEGLKPSSEIVNAVLNMPQPHDKAATRRFLGTITYLSKVCPRLGKVVHTCDLTTSIRNSCGLINTHKLSDKQKSWWLKLPVSVILMSEPQQYFRWMLPNMALVLHYFNQLLIPPLLQTSCSNL